MKLLTVALCTSMIAMPLLSHAGDLKIANNTKYNLSFRINNICSNSFGVVPSDTVKIIPEKDLTNACQYNPHYCTAFVYSQAGCSGDQIAEVGFDLSYGVSLVSGRFDHPLYITGNGFNLFFAKIFKH